MVYYRFNYSNTMAKTTKSPKHVLHDDIEEI